ncbi:MAG TPA: helix-turn-helix transcriptional regulator [Isosphaeraceae bacterium]|jgi:ribosome-binding protein aMBF1 (putative translation factor)|nr:helix-turn-helix transcriptional regulator [Isosphaeraceae bacterium]
MNKVTKIKIDWTAEQRAQHRAIHEKTKRERPAPDELFARGEVDEPVPLGHVVELRALLKQLKKEREDRGLSLTDVSERSGQTRAMISRLENGWNLNPNLATLFEYAYGIGVGINLAVDHSSEKRNKSTPPKPRRKISRPG